MALKLMWINANPNPNPGGTEAHSVDFIRYLENIKDIELYKVVAKGSFVDQHTSNKNKYYITLKSEFSPLNTVKLLRLAKRIKPDFIVGNNGNEYINTFLAGKFASSNIILFRHMLNRQPFFIKKFILPNVYKVVAVSESSKRRLMLDGVPEEKIEVIPNFIDDTIFSTSWEEKREKKTQLKIPENKKVVSFLGKVASGKGIYDFLEVAENILKFDDNYIFMVIGYGNELDKVMKIVREKGFENNFMFTKKVNNPSDYLKASDILLVLSKGEESFGRVVVEGFATRNLVIVYDVENLKYLVEEGKTGFICPVGNVQCVVDKIVNTTLFDQKSIVEKAYTEFLNNYTQEKVLNQFLKLIKEAV